MGSPVDKNGWHNAEKTAYLHADTNSENADNYVETQPDQHLRYLGVREYIQPKLQNKNQLTEIYDYKSG